MLRIRVYYENQRELGEMIKLLSPRLNYCRDFPDSEPKKCFLGIRTDDLADDLVSDNREGLVGTLEFMGINPGHDDIKGGADND